MYVADLDLLYFKTRYKRYNQAVKLRIYIYSLSIPMSVQNFKFYIPE